MKIFDQFSILTKFKIKKPGEKSNQDDNWIPLGNWLACAALFSTLIFIYQFYVEAPKPQSKREEVWSVDTYIPKNHTLIPIRVYDSENLDHLIGQFAVVNLFSAPLMPGEKPRFIAGGVKMIRSGKSQRHFSVLVHKNQASRIVGHSGEFHVTVRNPKIIGTNFVKEKRRRKRQIIYQLE